MMLTNVATESMAWISYLRQLRQYWIGKMFRSEVPRGPKIVFSTDMTLELVTAIPGSISFVRADDVSDNVKLVRVNGKLPSEDGYPLQQLSVNYLGIAPLLVALSTVPCLGTAQDPVEPNLNHRRAQPGYRRNDDVQDQSRCNRRIDGPGRRVLNAVSVLH